MVKRTQAIRLQSADELLILEVKFGNDPCWIMIL